MVETLYYRFVEVWVAHMPTVDKQILQIVALAGVFWTRYESIYFHDGGLGFDRNQLLTQ